MKSADAAVAAEDWLKGSWDVRDLAGNPVSDLATLASVLDCSPAEAARALLAAPSGRYAPKSLLMEARNALKLGERKQYTLTLKHLPGRHSQATHGRGWNGGRGRQRDTRGRFSSIGGAGGAVASLAEVLGDGQQLHDAVRSVLERVELPDGMTISRVVIPKEGTWKIALKDADGRDVAEFQRVAHRTPRGLSVHHSTAWVEPEWQGRGVATAVNNEFEYWYSDSGVVEIALTASGGGRSNGGYTWARAGYDWHPSNSADHIRGIIRDMRSRAGDDEDLQRIADGWIDQVNAAPHRPDRWPAPAQLTAFGYEPGATTWTGKEVMRNESWAGLKKPKSRPRRAA